MPGRGRGKKTVDEPQGVGPGPASGGGGRGRGRGAARQLASTPTGPGARRSDPVIKEVTQKLDDVSVFSQPTCSSGSSPIESLAVADPTNQELTICTSNYSVKARDKVPEKDEPDFDQKFRRRKIVLKANHFKLKIQAKAVWQYKLAFLHPAKGPAVKTKEDRRGIFDAFVDQYVEAENKMNVSGFDATMRPEKKENYSMVFDGMDLAYHYVDLTKTDFWQGNCIKSNWNKAIADPIAGNEQYRMAKNRKSGITWEFWKKEAEAANKAMLPDREKTRPLVKVEVNYKPRGRGRACQYPVMITQTKIFPADLISDVAGGKVRDQSVIQLIDVILRYASSKKNYLVGSTIFPKTQDNVSLGDNAYLWQGYSQSVRPNSWKSLTLNIDGKMSGFYKSVRVMDFAMELMKAQQSDMTVANFKSNNNQGYNKLEKALKGYVFTTTYSNVEYKISGIHDGSADTTAFETDEGTTTVADYFDSHLGKRLECPRAPLIRVGSKEKNGKLPPRTKLFPMEFCLLKGAQKVKQMNEDQISKLIKQCKPSDQMMTHIERLADQAKTATSEACAEWGIEIGNQMFRIENAEQLVPPKLEFGGQRELPAQKGSGDRAVQGEFDFRNQTFFKPRSLKADEWAVIGFGNLRCDRDVMGFAEALVNQGNTFGMTIEKKAPLLDKFRCTEDVEVFMRKNKQLRLLVVIMPAKSSEDYSYIKKSAELVHGIMTQCVLQKTVQKRDKRSGGFDMMTAANIMLKINHKLGGTNTRLAKVSRPKIFDKPVMVVGASLSHSMFGGVSVAAVTSSIDSGAALYSGFVAVQNRNDNFLIHDLDKFIVNALKAFYAATDGRKPHAIIYYRDGLSEGQYDKAVKYEMTMLRDGIRSVEESMEIGITMMSVQRRHNVKFFCSPKDAVGRCSNVPSGTVVDHDVTSGEHYDFYMYAHAGMMGTSRPAHFMLLHDDNDLTKKTLQVLSYHLCHSYARCTKTMAMPVCIYYAQLLAQRGRYWLRQQGYVDDDSVSTTSGTSTGSSSTNIEEINSKLSVHQNLQHEMFFC